MKLVLVAEMKAQCLEANFLLFFPKKIFEKKSAARNNSG